jgi:hypothetical protein
VADAKYTCRKGSFLLFEIVPLNLKHGSDFLFIVRDSPFKLETWVGFIVRDIVPLNLKHGSISKFEIVPLNLKHVGMTFGYCHEP